MSHSHSHDADDVSASECVDFLERIVYFIDNELDEADCSEVRRHLDSCNPCLEKYDLQRTVKSVVARSCSESAPAELRERVRIRIREVQVRITEV
ncbi:mycothiol system anti-sigma-R factor [Nocardioides sp.]|uniref:mycothiol system anti-sigma-R factor n=1 Tax=Nocardioides sp. TaxID=35761 RepID=UPI0031FECB53|nr:rsrA [Nocardioides sp.]